MRCNAKWSLQKSKTTQTVEHSIQFTCFRFSVALKFQQRYVANAVQFNGDLLSQMRTWCNLHLSKNYIALPTKSKTQWRRNVRKWQSGTPRRPAHGHRIGFSSHVSNSSLFTQTRPFTHARDRWSYWHLPFRTQPVQAEKAHPNWKWTTNTVVAHS